MNKKSYQMQCAVADVISIIGGIFVGKKVKDVTDSTVAGVAAGVTTTVAVGTVLNGAIARKNGVKPFTNLDDEPEVSEENQGTNTSPICDDTAMPIEVSEPAEKPEQGEAAEA